ncbi:hypothetical protein KC335_g60 [Hortaea werneckii]|nr:hypothetical protein KC335_g60 [Hortaea werneckii]
MNLRPANAPLPPPRLPRDRLHSSVSIIFLAAYSSTPTRTLACLRISPSQQISRYVTKAPSSSSGNLTARGRPPQASCTPRPPTSRRPDGA